jgi:hypothetical protein
MILPGTIEGFITTVLSAAQSGKISGKGYAYPVNGGTPFNQGFMTNGRKAVQGMVGLRDFTDLRY